MRKPRVKCREEVGEGGEGRVNDRFGASEGAGCGTFIRDFGRFEYGEDKERSEDQSRSAEW